MSSEPPPPPRLGGGVRMRWSMPADETTPDVRAIALSPDGLRIAVAAGARVLLYDTSAAAKSAQAQPTLLATLKAHKDAAVTSLDWSPDGQRFASTSEDGKVVVWSESGQGLLKYAHQTAHGPALQLTHAPCPPHRLCSVSARDLAVWTPGTKAVRKQRFGGGDDFDGGGAETAARISCVAWSPDGQQLAVASADGSIALRDATLDGGSGSRILVGSNGAGSDNGVVLGIVWTAAGTLVVGRSGGLLVFHLAPASSSFTAPVTVRLDTDPLHLRHLTTLEEAVLVAGQDGSLMLCSTKDGRERGTVAMLRCAITAMAAAAAASLVAVGTAGGHLHMLSLEPSSFVVAGHAEGKEMEEDEMVAGSSSSAASAVAAAASNSPADALEALMAAGRWDDALALVASAAALPGGISASDVLRRRAQWHVTRREWRAAVDALVAAGEPLRAVALVEECVASLGGSGSTRQMESKENGWWWPARLLDLVRSVDVDATQGREVVRACARLLALHDDGGGGDQYTKDKLAPMAREAFLRLGDVSGLMAHLTRRQRWAEVGALARERPGQFDAAAFVPYAGWLAAERGRVDEAVGALRAMGAAGEVRRLLLALVDNAVVEGRFKDASYGHWVLAVEALHNDYQQHPQQQDTKTSHEFAHHSALADIYFAYQHVHAHARQPFTKLAPHALLQAASFLLRSLHDTNPPPVISRVHTLYVLATQAEKLGARATARRAYDALAALHLPPAWRDAVDLRRLELRSADEAATATATTTADPLELLPLCYRCGLRNPLLPLGTAAAAGGDSCEGCGHPFIRSLLTLEVLPLVEFAPDPAQVPSAAQALALLRATDDADEDGGDRGGRDDEGARRFNACVARALEAQQQQRQQQQPSTAQPRRRASSSSSSSMPAASASYAPVLLGAHDLRRLRREEVFVIHGQLSSGAHEMYEQQRQHQGKQQPPGAVLPCRYYRNVLHPDAPLALSQAAGRFFGEEAFEAAWLSAQEEGEAEVVDGEETAMKRMEGLCCPFSRVRGMGDYGSA